MKHILSALVLALALISTAHANSLTTLDIQHISFVFYPNEGGDNALYFLSGPGIHLSGVGSASCSFCNVETALAAGQWINPSVFVDFEYSLGSVTIGNQSYSAVLFVSSIIPTRSFMLPYLGNVAKTFTVSIPAYFLEVSGETSNGAFFNLTIPPSSLVLTFDYYPGANGQPGNYYFAQGEFLSGVPEPCTLVLMATGLASMAGLIRRRCR